MAKGLQCFLSISLKPCTQEERFEVFSFKSVMHEMAFKVYMAHNFFLKFSNNGGLRPPFCYSPLHGRVYPPNGAVLLLFSGRYDFIYLHQLYNHTYLNISAEQWKQVVYLADWVEYHKYSKEMIGDIGGGLLANEIAESFSDFAAKKTKTKVCLLIANMLLIA